MSADISSVDSDRLCQTGVLRLVDTNGDGMPDVILDPPSGCFAPVDTNRDGHFDSLAYDTTGDDLIDEVLALPEGWECLPDAQGEPLLFHATFGAFRIHCDSRLRRAERDAEFLDVNKSLLISSLPRNAGSQKLRLVFSAFGSLASIKIIHDDYGSKCFGFVNFMEAAAAKEAFHQCARGRIILQDLRGKKWHVKASWARVDEGRPRGAGHRKPAAPSCLEAPTHARVPWRPRRPALRSRPEPLRQM